MLLCNTAGLMAALRTKRVSLDTCRCLETSSSCTITYADVGTTGTEPNAAANQSPKFEITSFGQKFRYFEQSASQANADTACKAQGAGWTLASLHSATQEAAITAAIKSRGLACASQMWIGVTGLDLTVNQNFAWYVCVAWPTRSMLGICCVHEPCLKTVHHWLMPSPKLAIA
jgi:hypothetical protein